MSQHYSDPSRDSDTYSLPDVEVFYVSAPEFLNAEPDTWMYDRTRTSGGCSSDLEGWYFWTCFPGCLPDSDAEGPYATELDALNAAQDVGQDGY